MKKTAVAIVRLKSFNVVCKTRDELAFAEAYYKNKEPFTVAFEIIDEAETLEELAQ